MRLQHIEDFRAPTEPPPAFTLFELGFRPFYLAAALWAVMALPLWLAELHGHAWRDGGGGSAWHAHEMLFGFAGAAIAGFAMTAVRNWTQQPTPRGVWLAALLLLWLGGRAGYLFAWPAGAVCDLAFLPAVAVAIGRNVVRARQWRNVFLPALMLLLGLANAAFYWFADDAAMTSLTIRIALFLVLMIEIAVAGRVIPGFTANAVPGVKPLRHPWLDRVAIGSTHSSFVLACLPVPGLLTAAVALVAALAQATRLIGWKPWLSRRSPILWVLHLAYAWIVVGLLLLAAAELDWIALSASLHAFAVGATAGLIVGMMTRTARGHTGRPVRAGAFEVAAYALIAAAALVRVAVALVPAIPFLPGLDLAATLWCLGFALFVGRFAAWLARPRADGLPG